MRHASSGHFHTVFLLSTTLCCWSYAQERHVASTISSVTIFSDRAQVTRTCSEELPAGEQALVFDHLPESIDRAGITVEGSGSGTLREVKFRQEPLAGYADSLTRLLSAEKRRLEDAIGSCEDRIKQMGSERQFVENIALKVTDRGTAQQTAAPELDNQKWQNMLDFYQRRLEVIDKEQRETTRSKDELNDSLSALIVKIANIGRDPKGSRNQAVATVFLKEPGRLTLNLSYIVFGPSWRPAYELRAKTEEKTLSLTYKAVIRQSTGEEWIDAALKLSTAQPSIGGNQPELPPWRIDFYAPPPLRIGSVNYLAAGTASNSFETRMAQNVTGYGSGGGLEAAAPPMHYQGASVTSGTANALFEIPGTTTVKSDNEEHTATIMTREFPAAFRYSTVPKLSQHAFLKAKIKNETEFPLLAGQAGVFLNNSFVATSHIDQVEPGEEFWTFLGVDEGIKIEHKLINRLQEQVGTFSKKTRITASYQISVTNNHQSDEEIVVFDQLPISGNEEIKVELIDPKWKENTPELHKNDQDILEWYYKMKPAEKVLIPLKYSVEFPEGKSVPGL